MTKKTQWIPLSEKGKKQMKKGEARTRLRTKRGKEQLKNKNNEN